MTLSYRSNAFSRVKAKNRERMDLATSQNQIRLLMESTISNIGTSKVTIKKGEETIELPNDAVIICAGGELPTPFLKKIGISVEAHYGS